MCIRDREIRNPPIVLKKTKPLQMGDDTAPAFGSSTYDWAMRIGRGKYTADEWLNHLTSTRKVNFKLFGKPSSRIERALKRFKYDPLVYGWVGKFGSSYEAWQACEKFADKFTAQKNKEIGCEEDTPTKQILALDEDTEKVLKVFKY